MRSFLSMTMGLMALVLAACDRESLVALHLADPSDYEVVALIARD
ncbi:MAG: hypothetical protein U1E23_15735 [Reyranellaceae bacterium]